MSYIGIPPSNIPADTVGSDEIEDASVATADLATGSVTFEKVNSGSIATQLEAEAGSSAVKLMTPQRTQQQMEAFYMETKVDTFATGVDFTPDVTTSLTLSFTPGSVNNLFVFFDAAYQNNITINSSGDLEFSAAIPDGVNQVTVLSGIAAPTGVPTDGSVTFQKLASGMIASQPEAEAGTSNEKLMTPQRAVEQHNKLNAGVSLYQTVATSLPNATWTLMDFDTEEYDDDDFHTVANGTEKIVTNFDGRAHFIASFPGATANGTYGIRLLKNGVVIKYIILPSAVSSTNHTMELNDIVPVAIDDEFTVEVYQSGNGTVDSIRTIDSIDFSVTFKMQRVR